MNTVKSTFLPEGITQRKKILFIYFLLSPQRERESERDKYEKRT